MFAHPGIEFEREGRLVQAVKVFQVQIQWADIQRYWVFWLFISKVYAVVAQLHILEQHLPRFAGCYGGRFWGLNRDSFWGLGFGCRFFWGAGKQLLPIKLPVFFARSPSFEVLAVDLANNHLLFGQINSGVADIQAFQTHQRTPVRGVDLEGGDTGRGVTQHHLGVFGQIQFVVRAEIQHTVFQCQRQCVTHIRPPDFHLAVGYLEFALGGNWNQAQRPGPINAPALGASRHKRHVRVVIGQRAEVFQLKVH